MAAEGERNSTIGESLSSWSSVPVNLRDSEDASLLPFALSCATPLEVVMRGTPTDQAEAALQQLAEQFSHWRQSRRTPYGPRIPDALWTEAVGLVQFLPLTQVAKALHRKPHALQRPPKWKFSARTVRASGSRTVRQPRRWRRWSRRFSSHADAATHAAESHLSKSNHRRLAHKQTRCYINICEIT